MSNYYGVGRTNYFKVKDPELFKEAVNRLSGLLLVESSSCPGQFMLMDDNPDGGGWCVTDLSQPRLDDFNTEEEFLRACKAWEESRDDFDLDEFISEHLADGEVAILLEVGHEQHRYLTGWAIAINNKGERRRVNLDDIYLLAEELTDRPEDITVAEY